MLTLMPKLPVQSHDYMPTHSSPLAPKQINVLHRPASTVDDKKRVAPRAVKHNPLMQRSTADATRERRRDLFFKRVVADRDERRWAGREDQIMRLDYVQKQRAWESQLSRSAPAMSEPEEGEEDNAYQHEEDDSMIGTSRDGDDFSNHSLHSSQSQPTWAQLSCPYAEAEADAVAQQEDQELTALLAMMEEDERGVDVKDDEAGRTYGSDEEDYDSLFREAVRHQQQGWDEYMLHHQDDDAMDTST